MSAHTPDLSRVFAADGLLAAAIPGFRHRPQQVEMAAKVAAAIAGNQVLVAEAGTGTGKTYAYLAPALLSGGKVIVSTGTKTLQDQLFQRDLPTVREALKVGATIALLKGRANYVCPYHLDRALAGEARNTPGLKSREEAGHLRAIARFAKTSHTGDKGELPGVPEDSGAWMLATSTRDNCLGQDCPNNKECFVINARREAMAADVVVVNHHLFFADVMLRDDGLGELLPACNTVIFDEAHQLPEVAGLFFGDSVSTAQILDLVRDARNEGLAAAKDYSPLQDACRVLDKAVRDLRLEVKAGNARLPAASVTREQGFVSSLENVGRALDELARHLESQAARAEGLANCLARSQDVAYRLKQWSRDESAVAEADADEASVKWVEVFNHALALNRTPLSVAPIFRR
ncbi:MAG: ATP-dependent DNA helicase, partial [Rhodocyclaceae bacterium]|nr:ATP-dependent DNA helicase [Rhodocyclaceae bacterium]